jgi:hypothetical protein
VPKRDVNDSSIYFKYISLEDKLSRKCQRPRFFMIIGGMFGLNDILDNSSETPPFITGQELFLINGRSGISLIVDCLKPYNIWLPSYLCASIIDAIRFSETRINFFEINCRLEIDDFSWIEAIERGDLVIFIDYFGFPVDSNLIESVKNRGAFILEDASQALLTKEVGKNSDFVLYSPRKLLGIPDGGILVCHYTLEFDPASLGPPPAEWWLKSLTATILRREFDKYGGDNYWFQLFQEVEANQPIGNFKMSELSYSLIFHSFDYSEIETRRKDNFDLLLDKLSEISVYKHLPSNVVPVGFPIRVKNRDQLRQKLFSQEIYPPLHWPIDGIVPESFTESHQLESEIMTLPCDQRCSVEDMERVANFLIRELENERVSKS